MKKKRILISITASVILLLILALTSPIVKQLGVEIATGYVPNTPEFAIASVFKIKDVADPHIQYINESDVLFALYTGDDHKSNFAVLAKDKNGKYTQDRESLISIGNLPIKEFDSGSHSSMIYNADGKYIVYVPIQGYSTNPDDEFYQSLTVVNPFEIKIYDSLGNDLKNIAGDNYALFYNVADDLPSDYKVYAEYKGNTYTILDVEYKNR